MTIHETIQEYILHRSKKLSPISIASYTHVLEKFARWAGDDRRIETIEEKDLDAYQYSLKQTAAVNYQVNQANILRGFFKFCVIRGYSIMVYQRIEGPRKMETHPAFITQAQFDQINACFTVDEYHSLTKKVMFNLLWDTGMRIGELLSLNVGDISSDKNYITIRTEKTHKLRVIVWSEDTHKLLMKYLGVRICMNQAPELFQTPSLAIHAYRKTRLTAKSVQRWCAELGNKLGFKMNPHAFRHGKMHDIINRGGDRHHVQAIAGHSNITSSEVYVRLNEQEQLRIQSKFLTKKGYTSDIATFHNNLVQSGKDML